MYNVILFNFISHKSVKDYTDLAPVSNELSDGALKCTCMKTIIVKLPSRPTCIKWYMICIIRYLKHRYVHSMFPKVITLVLGQGVMMTEMSNRY